MKWMLLVSIHRKPRISKDVWLSRFSSIHGEKYKYPTLNLLDIKSNIPIEITCPIHGSFFQKPQEHLKYGCRLCGDEGKRNRRKFTKDEFVLALNKKHQNKYSYSFLSKNPRVKDFVEVSCPIHGVFLQRIQSHLAGQGCPKCYENNKSGQNSLFSFDENEWTDLFSDKHAKDEYEYRFPENFNQYSKIETFCRTCNTSFLIVPYAHKIGKYKCPNCYPGNVSSYEIEIRTFLSELGISFESNKKFSFLNGKEIDIYIPEFNLGIEFNGYYWHSEKFLDKWYHHNKTRACHENGILLLHIWEHYWRDPLKKEIYFSKIKHFLKMDVKIHARKCILSDVSNKEALSFYKINHLDGCGTLYSESSSVSLSYNGEVVMIATYGKFYLQNEKSFILKLQRICTKSGYSVVGGVSRLLKNIEKKSGKVQFQITIDTGGTLLGKKFPDKEDVTLRYWWVNQSDYLTRNSCQVSRLSKNFDWLETDTEKSYMERNGWVQVWDSGIVKIKNFGEEF